MAARYTTIVKPVNRHRNAAMIAQSAVSASASGATVCVSNPRADPTVGSIPKNGAYRNFQTAPTATGARTNGRKNANWKNVLSALRVGDEDGKEQSEPGLEHDCYAGEQDGVQQAPVEDRVAEDRTCVVIEPDEVRELEALVSCRLSTMP